MYRNDGPYHWYDKYTYKEDYNIQWQTDFRVISEAIAADTLHEEVCLIANRCAEGCAGSYTNADEEGHRVDSQLLCYGQSQWEGEGCCCVVRNQLSKEVRNNEEYCQHGVRAVLGLTNCIGTSYDDVGYAVGKT